MRKEKFTPGPWHNDKRMVVDFDENLIADCDCDTGERSAEGYLIRQFDVDIQDANADLIAAGPDLYKALKKLVSLFEDYGPADWDGDWNEPWRDAKAALNKANKPSSI